MTYLKYISKIICKEKNQTYRKKSEVILETEKIM